MSDHFAASYAEFLIQTACRETYLSAMKPGFQRLSACTDKCGVRFGMLSPTKLRQ